MVVYVDAAAAVDVDVVLYVAVTVDVYGVFGAKLCLCCVDMLCCVLLSCVVCCVLWCGALRCVVVVVVLLCCVVLCVCCVLLVFGL